MNVPAFKTQRGFSFTEVMISLFVLSIGFLGVIGLATKTLQGSFAQRDAAIASLLAQEGIELVFNIRDTNIQAGNSDVFDGVDDGDYRIDYQNVTLLNGNNVNQCRLYRKNASPQQNFYSHTNAGGTATKFARKVTIDDTDPDIREVEVMVYWGGTNSFPTVANCSSSSKCIVATANMYR